MSVSLRLDRSARAAATAIAAAATRFDPSVQHVVVLGNGIAGITAADHVRRKHPDCSIDVVAAELHPLYNRMGISRLVYGRSAMRTLELLPNSWYEENRITTWLNTQASKVDREHGHVALATGEELPYDRLIFATGSVAHIPPLEDIDLRGVFALRTADDAMGLRAYVQRLRARRALVIGGGLLGLEAAYAVRKLGLSVTVVQRGSQLMSGQLDATAAALLARYLCALGLEIICGASPVAIAGSGAVTGVVLADGRELDTDLVLVCAGIVPDVELARAAGLEVGRGITVDGGMRTSDPAILAAGDCVEFDGEIHGLWPTAVEQAEVAAVNAVGGEPRSYTRRVPVALLKGVGLHLLALGVIEPADGDETIIDAGDGQSVEYRKLVIRDGRLVGGVLVGHQSDGPALLAAVHDQLDVSEGLQTLRRDIGRLAEMVP